MILDSVQGSAIDMRHDIITEKKLSPHISASGPKEKINNCKCSKVYVHKTRLGDKTVVIFMVSLKWPANFSSPYSPNCVSLDRAVEYQAACMFSSAEAEQLILLWREQLQRSAEWDILSVRWPVFSPTKSKVFSHCWFIPGRGDNILALFFFRLLASTCLPPSGCLGRCCKGAEQSR